MVSSSFLISKLAALVTNSRSMQRSVAFELLSSPEFGFRLVVGRDFRLQKKSTTIWVTEYRLLNVSTKQRLKVKV